MTSITIKYPNNTNIREETLGNHTYLTLSNPVAGQIEIVRSPPMQMVQQLPPIQQIPTIQRNSTTITTGPILPSGRVSGPRITPQFSVPSPVFSPSAPYSAQLSYSTPTQFSVPSPVFSPSASYSSPNRVSYTPPVITYPEIITPRFNQNETSCIGDETTLMVTLKNNLKNRLPVEELVNTLENYVDVKCTEVRSNNGHKLLTLHFNNREDVETAYAAIKSNYGNHADIELFK